MMISLQQAGCHSTTTARGNHNGNKIAQSYTTYVSGMILKGNMKRCRIQNCFITDKHAIQIAKSIRDSHCAKTNVIQTFSLDKCPNISTNGIVELLRAVGQCCANLTKLELSKVYLDDIALQELVTLLSLPQQQQQQHSTGCWPKLKDLSLVETNDDMAEEPTCPETWQAFFRAVLCHPTLRSLDLTFNDLDCNHMEALADELLAVRRNNNNSAPKEEEEQGEQRGTGSSFPTAACGLDSLILARNPIGDQGLKALCRGFSDRGISTTVTTAVATSSFPNIRNNMPSLSSLSLLSLGECSLTDLSPLLEVCCCYKEESNTLRNKVTPLAGLERLYLYANQITDEDQTKQIQEFIHSNFERNEAERERREEVLLSYLYY